MVPSSFRRNTAALAVFVLLSIFSASGEALAGERLPADRGAVVMLAQATPQQPEQQQRRSSRSYRGLVKLGIAGVVLLAAGARKLFSKGQ